MRAFCKGRRYGTILVNLELNQPAHLILKRVENRDDKDRQLLTQIGLQHSNLALTVELADEFLQLLREQQADAFDRWLMKALKSSLKPFVSFDRCVYLKTMLRLEPV